MSDNRKCGHFLRSSNELIELAVGATTCPWCEIAERDATIAELRESLKMSNAVSDCLGRQVADKDADRIFFRDELKKAEIALAAARVNEAKWNMAKAVLSGDDTPAANAMTLAIAAGLMRNETIDQVMDGLIAAEAK